MIIGLQSSVGVFEKKIYIFCKPNRETVKSSTEQRESQQSFLEKRAEFCQNKKFLTFILILAKYKENLLNRDAWFLKYFDRHRPAK